ncbi:MAG: hypothetical protein JRH19_09485 [Deltaproteobacteria bacterium]|nr:hypothetical protein [Deltaproteobacteria bacterium]
MGRPQTRPRSSLILVALPCLAALALACSESERREDEGTQNIEGVYRVEGLTTEVASGLSRALTGLVVVRQDGDRYTTNFDLASEMPATGRDAGEEVSIEIVGEGEGVIDGDSLRGTANTQIMRSVVPGVHVSFGLMPRAVGPRIVSTTKGHIGPDQELTIEIETRSKEGADAADYSPTRTRLVGHRVGAVGEAPPLPRLAPPSPKGDE